LVGQSGLTQTRACVSPDVFMLLACMSFFLLPQQQNDSNAYRSCQPFGTHGSKASRQHGITAARQRSVKALRHQLYNTATVSAARVRRHQCRFERSVAGWPRMTLSPALQAQTLDTQRAQHVTSSSLDCLNNSGATVTIVKV
jgi:hypothetical protein